MKGSEPKLGKSTQSTTVILQQVLITSQQLAMMFG
jgi:hypothetical protein